MHDLRATYLTATYQATDNRQFDVPICVKDGQPRLHFPSGAVYEITEHFQFSDIGTARLVAYNPRAGVQISQPALDRMVAELKLPAIPKAPPAISTPAPAPEPPMPRNLREARILNEQEALARLTARQNQSRIIMENPTPAPRQQALNDMAAANREQISRQHRDRAKARGR